MAAISELIRKEDNGSISFGDYTLSANAKYKALLCWIYNKKVDKYDKIEDRKRRNKKCLQKIRNTPRNISKQ